MYLCGYTTGTFADEGRSNWPGDGPRPISWSAWYPTHAEPTEEDREKEKKRIFVLGEVAEDSPLSDVEQVYPVALLSHGTGGSAEGFGWLARELAIRGYIVLAPNHHGNTGYEPYYAEAFVCWWERAADMSMMLDRLSGEGAFAGRLDLLRVFAAGFSIGGHTVLSLVGGRTSLDQFLNWAEGKPVLARGMVEFPNMVDKIPELYKYSQTFRESVERQGADYSNAYIGPVFALAPAPPVRALEQESLQAIKAPVHILTGGADDVAPREDCADWLKAVNPAFEVESVGRNVGHFSFLGPSSRVGRRFSPLIFTDNEGVDRLAVHKTVVDKVLNVIS